MWDRRDHSVRPATLDHREHRARVAKKEIGVISGLRAPSVPLAHRARWVPRGQAVHPDPRVRKGNLARWDRRVRRGRRASREQPGPKGRWARRAPPGQPEKKARPERWACRVSMAAMGSPP